MSQATDQTSAKGTVLSLHLHPPVGGAAMIPVSCFELVEAMGILSNSRYWNRRSASGEPTKRQVTLIEREIIEAHASALGVSPFPPGLVRSNIETSGINLMDLLGRTIRVGQAVVKLVEPRTPCQQMEAIRPGLKALMENGRQGALAQVLTSGLVQVGDPILVLPLETPAGFADA